MDTYALDGISLLFCNTDSLCTWWKHVITIFAQELQKLLFVLSNELCNLRVASSDLLENGLEHLRLLLNKLAQLLEVAVVPQEVEIWESFTSAGTCTRSCTSTGARTPTVSCLRSGLEQVDRFTFATGSSGSRWCRWCGFAGGRGRGSGSSGSSFSLALFLLDVVRNTLKTKSISGDSTKNPNLFKLTLNRYSIARSGLKKAALIARLMSSLAKPMLSI